MGPATASKLHFETLQNYYASLESRIGYHVFLGGTRHFGYYEDEKAWPWPIGTALRAMEDYLFDALDLPTDSLVLDAGCGYGHVACRGAERGLRIEGIDIVNRHVARAQEAVHKRGFDGRVKVRVGDYHDLSMFADSTFDGLYTMETFVHANDTDQVLVEFFRVLKPGAHITMHEYEHSPEEQMSAKERDIMDVINKYSAMPAHSRFVFGTLKKTLEAAGFEDVHVEDISKRTMPLVWLFYIIALVPYLILTVLGLRHHFVNAVAGVASWRLGNAGVFRYVVVTAQKPGVLSVQDAQQTASTAKSDLRKRV